MCQNSNKKQTWTKPVSFSKPQGPFLSFYQNYKHEKTSTKRLNWSFKKKVNCVDVTFNVSRTVFLHKKKLEVPKFQQKANLD